MRIRELREKYLQGVNIMAYLREKMGIAANTPEIVLRSYDLQAGSYIRRFDETLEDAPAKVYRKEAAELIAPYPARTILEAGVGEATTLFYTAKQVDPEVKFFGFDISWSRLAVARAFLKRENISNVSLATGDLFSIPLADNSIDLVYTSHSIEPNGGRECEIIRELYRVARRWLILLEPSNELGGNDTRQRIETNGYCKNLSVHARQLGLDIREHRLLKHPARPDNQTAIIVISKETSSADMKTVWACPDCKSHLEEIKHHLFCSECLCVYPQLDGIPCLLQNNAIVATRFCDEQSELTL